MPHRDLVRDQLRHQPDGLFFQIERRSNLFHSGKWRGYWEQTVLGRQAMHPLSLRFSNGQIEGEGRDILGAFTFAGTYDPDGVIKMLKQYIGKHAVLYAGTYDGEGTVFGQWVVAPGIVGPFALHPDLPSKFAEELPIRDIL